MEPTQLSTGCPCSGEQRLSSGQARQIPARGRAARATDRQKAGAEEAFFNYGSQAFQHAVPLSIATGTFLL